MPTGFGLRSGALAFGPRTRLDASCLPPLARSENPPGCWQTQRMESKSSFGSARSPPPKNRNTSGTTLMATTKVVMILTKVTSPSSIEDEP